MNLRSFSLCESHLFLPTYFVKCRRSLLKLNSKGPYPNSEREVKFRRCLFTYYIKRAIRHFHVVVVQKRNDRNVKKSTCKVVVLLIKPIEYFNVLVAVALLDLKLTLKQPIHVKTFCISGNYNCRSSSELQSVTV